MKIKVLLLGLAIVLTVGVQAQNKDITKFMGIPVDGTKTDMIQKLKAKGFTYNAKMDRLEGKFNGRDSYISVGTNRNKVYRIMVQDASYSSETDIRIRFNNLVKQFLGNEKYMPAPTDLMGDFFIDENTDISYNISVNNKRFEASFYQVSDADKDTTGKAQYIRNKIFSKYNKMEFYALSEEVQEIELKIAFVEWMLKKVSKKFVWFMIDDFYGSYGILLYYDNKYNESNGEDL